ncbi:NUDIX hydrolase [Promicromonospora sukumoe]|uniref:NUDIX hydrolase n=1 Tax=Promicromonospora sukumoe TaxID=88382 RepID=UPI001E604E7F|nr:NUDIX domain-containing protein [Promicromonospora sukumoe]
MGETAVDPVGDTAVETAVGTAVGTANNPVSGSGIGPGADAGDVPVPGVVLHRDALATLRAWTGATSEQERLRARYVAHLEATGAAGATGATGEDAAGTPGHGVLRTSVPDHLTASTLVLSHDGARVLLTLHAKARRWFQLGGHLEPGDRTLANAAAREAREESGIADLVVDPVPVHLDEHVVPFCRPGTGDPDRPVHHLDVRFVAVAGPDAETALSDESLALRWWPADALPDPELTELVRLARARTSADQVSPDQPGRDQASTDQAGTDEAGPDRSGPDDAGPGRAGGA